MTTALTCPHCGGDVKRKDKIATGGWILIACGIVLAPVCIGLLLIFAGLFVSKKQMVCQSCGAVVTEIG